MVADCFLLLFRALLQRLHLECHELGCAAPLAHGCPLALALAMKARSQCVALLA